VPRCLGGRIQGLIGQKRELRWFVEHGAS
jgi:hypothetical protein